MLWDFKFLSAFVVGFVMTLSSYGFMTAMLAFFFAGSKVTKWRADRKRKFEADFKEGRTSLLAVNSLCVERVDRWPFIV